MVDLSSLCTITLTHMPWKQASCQSINQISFNTPTTQKNILVVVFWNTKPDVYVKHFAKVHYAFLQPIKSTNS